MMIKESAKRAAYFLTFVFIFSSFVSSASISVNDINSSYKQVVIEDAVALYGYELNFSIVSGSVVSVLSSSFLGDSSQATYGYIVRDGYLYVYGSILNATHAGVNGTGELFNISITEGGEVLLRGFTGADSIGGEINQAYNVPAEESESPGTGSSAGSSGGGGGGGGVLSLRKELNVYVSPSDFSIETISGKRERREFNLVNNGENELLISLNTENLGNAITFQKNLIELPGNGEVVVPFDVFLDARGLLAGKITLTSGDYYKEIPVILNVKSENFLFDASISLVRTFRRILQGTDLTAEISLLQVGPPEKVDVVANYIIKDFSGNSYFEDSETFFVLSEKKFLKEFHTSQLNPGKYIIGLEIVYPGAFATSSTQFEVLEEGFNLGLPKNYISVFFIMVIFAIGVAAVVWSLVRKKKLYKRKM